MQAATILAALQKAAHTPAMAGIYIKSVSISAVHDWTHDPTMLITWSMPDSSSLTDNPAAGNPVVRASVLARPSDTAMQLARELASPGELEDAILHAAWRLGAWDLVRLERSPLPRGADWHDARYGIMSNFGRDTTVIYGQPLVRGDGASDKTCELAAAHGYVSWRLVPLALATPMAKARWRDKDRTLLSDCTRAGEPAGYRAAWCHPTDPQTGNEHIYQLGRATHGNRSKANQPRQAQP